MTANKYFTHSVFLGGCIGILLTIIGVLFSMPLSQLLGAEGETLALTNVYLKTLLSFAPFFIWNNTLLAFVRNDNNPKLAMSAMLIGSFSNIVLDYIFIYPLNWGMFGASFATGLSPIISLCVVSLHFIKGKNNFHLKLCRAKLSYIRNILSLGISTFITELSSGVVLIAFNLVILGLAGNTGVAAYGIIANLSLVIISVFTGIAQGVQPLLSESCGMGETFKMKCYLKYSLIAAFLFSLAVYLFSVLNSDLLISIFNKDSDIILHDLAEMGIRLYFAGFFFAGVNIVTTIFFSAVERPKQAFAISITRGFAAVIPLVLLLSALLGMNGVWLSFTFAELLTTLLAMIFILKSRKKLFPSA